MSRSGTNEGTQTRCYVAFSIIATRLDFEEISSALNQEPAEIRGAGSQTSAALKPQEDDVWTIASPLDPSEPVEEHLRWLHTRLEPRAKYLAELSRSASLRVYIGLTLSAEQNGFRISQEFVRFIASINAFVDFFILCDFGEGETPDGQV
jgi:hypothetical protein